MSNVRRSFQVLTIMGDAESGYRLAASYPMESFPGSCETIELLTMKVANNLTELISEAKKVLPVSDGVTQIWSTVGLKFQLLAERASIYFDITHTSGLDFINEVFDAHYQNFAQEYGLSHTLDAARAVLPRNGNTLLKTGLGSGSVLHQGDEFTIVILFCLQRFFSSAGVDAEILLVDETGQELILGRPDALQAWLRNSAPGLFQWALINRQIGEISDRFLPILPSSQDILSLGF